jgi:large subunit ribosomal protein L23
MASIKKSVYEILRVPRITEKSAMAQAVEGSVVFEVHPRANKIEIKSAVEQIFDVKVKAVRTSNYKGKTKRVGQKVGVRGGWKKAYVALEEGSSIDIIEGL